MSNLRRLKAFARTHLETGELLRQIGQRGQVPLEQIALQRRRHTEQFGQGAEPTPSQKASSRTDHANTHPPAAKLSLQHRGVRPMTVTICQPQDTRRRSCGQSSCGVCVDVTRHTSSINTEPQGQALGGSPWWRSLGIQLRVSRLAIARTCMTPFCPPQRASLFRSVVELGVAGVWTARAGLLAVHCCSYSRTNKDEEWVGMRTEEGTERWVWKE